VPARPEWCQLTYVDACGSDPREGSAAALPIWLTGTAQEDVHRRRQGPVPRKGYEAQLLGWIVDSRLCVHRTSARLKSRPAAVPCHAEYNVETLPWLDMRSLARLVNAERAEPAIGLVGTAGRPMPVIREALHAREAQIVPPGPGHCPLTAIRPPTSEIDRSHTLGGQVPIAKAGTRRSPPTNNMKPALSSLALLHTWQCFLRVQPFKANVLPPRALPPRPAPGGISLDHHTSPTSGQASPPMSPPIPK
jgi:hypothetical protein